MAIQLTNIDDFIDYCLRALGQPVINVEIDYDQSVDRVEDAVKKFIQRHYDGVEHTFLKQEVTYDNYMNKYLTIPNDMRAIIDVMEPINSTSPEYMANIQYQFMAQNMGDIVNSGGVGSYYIGMMNLSLLNREFGRVLSYEFNKATNRFAPQFRFQPFYNLNHIKTPTDLTSANWTLTNCSVSTGSVVDPLAATTGTGSAADLITTGSAGTWSITQTVTEKYNLISLYTFINYFKAINYAGQLTLKIIDNSGIVITTKNVTLATNKFDFQFVESNVPQTNGEQLTVEISGTSTGSESFAMKAPRLSKNTFFIFRGYKAINEAVDIDIWNDEWLKRYATALIKRQWGSNTKKFSGVQLPGGITLEGQVIYDEAQTEIEKLEDELLELEEPMDLMWG